MIKDWSALIWFICDGDMRHMEDIRGSEAIRMGNLYTMAEMENFRELTDEYEKCNS